MIVDMAKLNQITDRDRQEAEVLRTQPRSEQELAVKLILDQAENPHLTSDDRTEARRRGEALRKLLRLRV
ncbi:MAG: hypothetical protein K8T89_10970 [Planctomycetes bacterium]|nr:hypothetical protein [Planctomycetota bacterium]